MGSKTKDSGNIHLSCMAQSGELNCHVYCRISEQDRLFGTYICYFQLSRLLSHVYISIIKQKLAFMTILTSKAFLSDIKKSSSNNLWFVNLALPLNHWGR